MISPPIYHTHQTTPNQSTEMVAEKETHVYVLPYFAQSHINPMLEFSKSLASNPNLKLTFILIAGKSPTFNLPPISRVAVASISDGSEAIPEPESTADSFRRIRIAVSGSLIEFLKQRDCSSGVLIYDSVFPWMLEIARERGLLAAAFVTQSCSVTAVYYQMKVGLILRFPFGDCTEEVEMPGLPALGRGDLPALEKVMDSEMTMVRVLGDQFSNLGEADFVLFNSFDALEDEVIQWMSNHWAVKTIGPTNLIAQKHTNSSHNTTINLFEPDQEACTKWLDSREPGSVVYVSFGSIIGLDRTQMEELAWGLTMSRCWFLWVVRASEKHKLPPNFAPERGLIVSWCSQTDVLAHRAVSCFLTHGGWNSTLEGLSHGVPLVVMPHWVDQTTNAKFVEDVWGVGVRVRGVEEGMVMREEVCGVVKEVVYGEKGKELRKNGGKWRKMAEEAVGDEGSTTKNIRDIVSRILS